MGSGVGLSRIENDVSRVAAAPVEDVLKGLIVRNDKE